MQCAPLNGAVIDSEFSSFLEARPHLHIPTSGTDADSLSTLTLLSPASLPQDRANELGGQVATLTAEAKALGERVKADAAVKCAHSDTAQNRRCDMAAGV